MNKKIVVALAAGIAVAGTVGASAATLGGLSSKTLGTDSAVVASCDTDGVTAAYVTAYNPTLKAYDVTGVTLSAVNAACTAKSYSLTLADVNGAVLKTMTGTLTVAASAATIPVTATPAGAVKNMSLVITG